MRAPRRAGVLALTLLTGILVVGSTPSAGSPSHSRHVTKRAHVRVAVRVKATVRRTVSVTATATAGNPAVTVRATAKATAMATRYGKGTARRSALGTAPTQARALHRAHARAKVAAHRVALHRARVAAHRRAASAAHAAALKRARALATARARAAAARAAAGQNPPIVTPPVTDPPVTDPPVTVQPVSGEACGGAPTAVHSGSWTCTFDDEFAGSGLDDTKWSAVTTADTAFGYPAPACYVDDARNISVSSGTLKLTARETDEPFTCHDTLHGDTVMTRTSGTVSSIGKFDQAYGVFSIRAKFTKTATPGLQSSLWMWPTNPYKYGVWPGSGELDIAEYYSQYPDRVIPYLHYNFDPASTVFTTLDDVLTGLEGTNVDTNDYCMVADADAFHEYTMVWEPGTITIEFDGHTCMIDHYVSALGLPTAPFDQPFFMILSQALGIRNSQAVKGNEFLPDSTPLPATTEVDYVRVWQRAQ